MPAKRPSSGKVKTPSKGEITLVCGYPASGKSTVTQQLVDRGCIRLNRDTLGGKVDSLATRLDALIEEGERCFVLDNLYATRKSRAPVIQVGKKHGIPVVCWHLQTTLEDAQYNACVRMIERAGKVLSPEECKKHKDPNLFPVAVLYAYRKEFEKPAKAEGFREVIEVPFERRAQAGYKHKGLILDYDGCLRTTKSGAKYPTEPDDVEVLPGRGAVLKKFRQAGYRLLGASNQSGITKGEFTAEEAEACFERTNQLLGVAIEYAYCPHRVPPIACYCRKPGPGMGVQWIEQYKLDRSKTLMVGDMKTDATFAARCGIGFCDADEFFEDDGWEEWLDR